MYIVLLGRFLASPKCLNCPICLTIRTRAGARVTWSLSLGCLVALRCRARAGFSLTYDVGPARVSSRRSRHYIVGQVFLGEAEKTKLVLCVVLGPASRVKCLGATTRYAKLKAGLSRRRALRRRTCTVNQFVT